MHFRPRPHENGAVFVFFSVDAEPPQEIRVYTKPRKHAKHHKHNTLLTLCGLGKTSCTQDGSGSLLVLKSRIYGSETCKYAGNASARLRVDGASVHAVILCKRNAFVSVAWLVITLQVTALRHLCLVRTAHLSSP